MQKKYCSFTFWFLGALLCSFTLTSQTLTGTYTDGDIPTNYNSFDSACNGPGTTLSFTLPATGGPWEITGLDVEYEMTTASGAYMSEQRSKIYFQNTGEEEVNEEEDDGWYHGVGTGGTFPYNRTNVEVANGYYPDAEELVFEMRAWRTWPGGTNCGTNYNKVDDGTWTITLYYQEAPSCLPPQNGTFTNIEAYQADVSWEEIGSAPLWNIEYGEAGFTQGEGTVIAGLDIESYQITSLNSETEYDVYIQSDCGSGDESTWSGPYTFTTLVSCPAPENLQLVDATIEEASFTFNASPNESNGYTWVLMPSGSDPEIDTPEVTGTLANAEPTEITAAVYPDSAYDFYVKADCGSTDGESSWAGPVSFTTPIIGLTIDATGYNADVIANGVGTMESSTTNDVDGVNYCFLSEDWKLTEESADLGYGLPLSGTITSSDIEGLTYQLRPYDENNSFRVETIDDPSILTLNAPASFKSLYLLTTSGSGSASADVEVHFADETSETFTGNTIPDWFYSTALPVEASGFGRGNLDDDDDEPYADNPRLYRLSLNLDEANHNKLVESITVTKNSGGVINVFAVSGSVPSLCATPANLVVSDITDTSATITWDASLGETGGYEWALMLSGEVPETGTPVNSGTTTAGETTLSLSDLDEETGYDFYVKSLCDAGEESEWATVSFETTGFCPAPENVQLEDLTATTAEFSWDASFAETNGYTWTVMLSGETPGVDTPVDTGTVATGVTTASISGLEAETTYDFYVNTDCGANGESLWSEVYVFETTPICPAPSLIQDNGTDTVSTTISWAGSFAEVNGYIWVLMLEGNDPATDESIAEGTTESGASTLFLEGLISETGYDFYIQTDCDTDGLSTWEGPHNFTTEALIYCEPTYSNGNSGWKITEIEVPEIPFSHSITDGNVTDYTDQVIEVQAGITYTFEVTTTGWTGVGIAADFNLDGAFEDEGELLGEPYYTGDEIGSYVFSVAVPTDIASGDYRIRFWNALANSGDDSGNESPCGNYGYGTFADLTLNIVEFDCATYDTPTGEGGQEFIAGQTVADLAVEGTTPNSVLTWYEDAELTTVIPETTALVDGVTYYVTQEVVGCVSEALAVTVTEFTCPTLAPLEITEGVTCGTGTVTLTATGAAEGYTIQWYDAEVGGTLVAEGETYEVELSETTSFWAEQVLIQGESVWCSSEPVEVIGTVTLIPDLPTGDAGQSVCPGATLAELVVIGDNIQWYTTDQTQLSTDTEIEDGVTYQATQTVNACESEPLEITVTFTPQSEMPIGDTNQTFVAGNTLADLDVQGENLTWYADAEGTIVIEDTTELEDQTTYYISQTEEGLCESELLAVTVYETFSVEHVDFSELSYYPNPVRHTLTVSNTVVMDKIALFTVRGREIFTREVRDSKVEVSFAEFPEGMYLLQITIEGNVGVYKIIKDSE